MADIDELRIQARMAALLTPGYGTVSVHGGNFEFHEGSAPPQNILDAARAKATEDITFRAVKAECQKRIYAVVKDDATQANMLRAMMLITSKQAGSRQALTAQEQADLKMFHALDAWIQGMRQAWRNPTMLTDDAYLKNSSWPKPPSGYGSFIARF